MIHNNQKISIRQAAIILVLACVTPLEKTVYNYSVETAKQAVWLCPLVALLFWSVFVLMLHSMFNGKEMPQPDTEQSIQDIFTAVLGNIITNVLTAGYALWSLMLAATFLRANAQRFSASIFPEVPKEFFLIALLVIVSVTLFSAEKGASFPVTRAAAASRCSMGKFAGTTPQQPLLWGTKPPFSLEAFSRFSELTLYIFIGVFAFLVITVLPQINVKNLLPITTFDALPILKGSVYIMSSWAFITFILFMGRSITGKDRLRRWGFIGGGILAVFSLIIIVLTVGTFGANLAAQTNIPLFMTIKSVRLLGTLERTEAIFITLWTTVDFVAVAAAACVLIEILSGMFSKGKRNRFPLLYIIPSILLIYLLSALVPPINGNLFCAVNLALGLGVPVCVFLLGKLRRKF